MDFTALVAGSAQAGHSSPLTKPGIGLAAGAGASPTCDAPADGGDAFASLVDLALGQLGTESSEGSAAATGGGTTRSTDDEGDEAAVEAAATPVEGPVDPATLAVLIALATPPVAAPVTQPSAAPEADAAGQAGADLAAIDGGVAGTSITAAETALDGGPQRSTGAAGHAAEFQTILDTAVTAPEPTAVRAAATAPTGPAAAASAASVAAAAVTGADPEAQAAVAADGSTAGAPAPAPAAGGADGAPAAAPAALPRATAPPSNHPLRQALAAIAAESTPPASAQAQATSATATAAVPSVVAQAALVAADAAPATHESRTPAATAETPASAAVATAFAAAGSGSTGDTSSGGSTGDSAAPAFHGAEVRFDASVPAAAPSAAVGIPPEALASSALTAVAGFGTGPGGDAALRAIDLPAAARFEQTLSSLDPDVRNLQAMVRTVRLFTAGSGASEARLILEPEHLGQVALTVRVEQGSVSAHFRAETPAAHRWIETHQQELRSGLREQGLEVKEVVVTTDPDGRRERQRHEAPVKPRPRRQAGADAPRFEVLV